MAPRKGQNAKSDDKHASDSVVAEHEDLKQTNDDEDQKYDRHNDDDCDDSDHQSVSDTEHDTKFDESQINIHKKTWKKSSIRSILTDYGMPDDMKKKKNKAGKGNKVQKSKSKSYDDNHDDERLNVKRERNLQRYEDIQKLRSLYYKVNLEELKNKVEGQREQLRKKEEEKENKLRAQEEKEKLESHKVKKRFQHHLLDHDDDFVRRVPKSDNYKIVALQDKMKNMGLLKNQEDYDNFWESVKNPTILQRYLEIYKPLPLDQQQRGSTISGSASDLNHRSRTSSTSHPVPDPKPPIPQQQTREFRPLTNIQESRESSRPVTRDLTMDKDRGSISPKTKIRMDPYMIAKMAAAELERKCPQMELPPMSCFTMEVGEKPRDPDEVLAELSAERRQKERKLFIKRLRRMYHLSRSNGASAQRIITNHDDMNSNHELCHPALSDIIAIDEITKNLNETIGQITAPPTPAIEYRPWTRYINEARRKSIMPILEEPSESRSTSAGSSTSRLNCINSASSLKRNKQVLTPLIPLSLTTMDTKVVEAKCMSSMWTNYLHVGESKFSPMHS